MAPRNATRRGVACPVRLGAFRGREICRARAAAFVCWVLYGVWYFRRWAKYPLIALLIVTFIMTASEIPGFPDLDSIARFVLGLLCAGANLLAYDELKKAVKINPPLI